MLIDSGLPLWLWLYGVCYTIWLKNRTPNSILPKTTPYEVKHGTKPDLSRAHRFGCKAFIYDSSPNRNKLNPRAIEG
ncbi:hypothetical protein HYPSUDRAFT_96846, partial [Hypholoma sublateritium FD-334 SS-4]